MGCEIQCASSPHFNVFVCLVSSAALLQPVPRTLECFSAYAAFLTPRSVMISITSRCLCRSLHAGEGATSFLTPAPCILTALAASEHAGAHMRRFFGGAFGGGFGFGGGDDEEQTPKGHDVRVDLEVSLRDLYVGTTIRVRLGRTCHPSR